MISFIIKRQIPCLSRRQLYRCDEAFHNELNIYTNVVPLLKQYMCESVFPNCLYAGQDKYGEIIVLQDLKATGYKMENRLAGLELNYCENVMKKLAILHAASIAAKVLNNDIFKMKLKNIREIVYCKEAEEFYSNILEIAIKESLYSLRASNVDGCLTEPIRLIEKLQNKLYIIVQNWIINSCDDINVICHGDLWVNNMMFKTTTTTTTTTKTNGIENTNNIFMNLQQQPPTDVQFFDLQAMRYTSPVFDILHFIYTSTKRDLRDSYTKHLLKTYCLALTKNLEMQIPYSFHERNHIKDTFSLSNITSEYYKYILYGLAVCIWILPAVTFDPNNIPNLDVISQTNINIKEIKCTQKLTPAYHSRIKDLALEFYQNGYLTNYLNEMNI